uniref:hypothetical protein n=1 Tax=Streptomyces sp. SAT1 TaxID=1849967 RepID=UPI0007F9B62E|nr:hypothetical protein [Streptomyces sp. SAT1]ANO42845.1 hypothetical protein A8713_037015 [Streptomyces sp. SAT1]
MDTRDLWWAAGQLALQGPVSGWPAIRWEEAVRRAARLLEPVWTRSDSAGPSTWALPGLALLLYADEREAEEVTVEQLVAALRSDTSVEERVREGVRRRGLDLEGDSPLSALVVQMTQHRPPVETAGGFELPSMERSPGGSLLRVAARWAAPALTRCYLRAAG